MCLKYLESSTAKDQGNGTLTVILPTPSLDWRNRFWHVKNTQEECVSVYGDARGDVMPASMT